jgi:pyruvate dehydrogenase E2 component (dihydrolipoamide acetyltransferase)
MPKFDMDQTSATVVEWLKKEGDFVEFDEGVLVVETEKVAMEVTAPASGILSGILAEQGDEVPVTVVIAYILAEGETEADIPVVEPQGKQRSLVDTSAADRFSRPSATPVAARMAGEMGIDLHDVRGAEGRIRKSDIEKFADSAALAGSSARAAATPAARRLARQMEINLSHISGTGPRGRIQKADVKTQGALTVISPSIQDRDYEILPLTSIRRTIAARMQSSFQTAPHISLSVEVDVTAFESARAAINAARLSEGSQRISVTTVLVYLTAQVLSQHKEVNASYIDDQIYLWKDINIGVATAVDEGLVVPVVHDAKNLSIEDINDRLLDLVARARSGKLNLSDVKSGTFTISNLGMFGIHQFRAIINPPESAILAVGAVVRRPVVVTDEDKIEVRPMMNLTLSADHRVLDGISAARFLSDLAGVIHSPAPLP